MPVLGVIFLRHATNRYQTALQAIESARYEAVYGWDVDV